MHVAQLPFRALYEALRDYEGDRADEDVLQPWLRRNQQQRRRIAQLARVAHPARPCAEEERWWLYAISRIVDLLVSPLAPAAQGASKLRRCPPLAPAERLAFFEALGLEPFGARGELQPFLHEVVAVEEDPSAEPATVESLCWPGLRVGALLILRAGARARASRRVLDPEIATSSTLYWAFTRDHRPTLDLSVGWGSNSQWRTELRLDYLADGAYHYNVGAREQVEELEEADLDAEAQLELLRHRCFVRTRAPHDDRWPYDWTHEEPATAGWPAFDPGAWQPA